MIDQLLEEKKEKAFLRNRSKSTLGQFKKSQIENRLVDLWLQDSKSSFIYDLYKTKKECFQSLLDSVYISRGQELHEKLQMAMTEISRKETKAEKLRQADEKEIAKLLTDLREHYWMSELKFLQMAKATDRLTLETKKAELMAVIRFQLAKAEKDRIETLLGPKNMSAANLSDRAEKPKKDMTFNIPEEAQLLDKFEKDKVELKKYNKSLKSKLLGRYLFLFNNIARCM